ncbi:alanine racemase [Flagellimonas halotolerans]|uniref:Alanine racemase n=1 Tax=Flagellimonas halotolerans TaxID=3112164 RepID=A0ABU6IKZ5_9FLAO|nr:MULTISPECIES: alanine racemase [unclassified Allomuricauda]MEC3963868.1 alanine racemase [Muricauda sp. SYSU M86414]MEC4263738.1 alanine racemase [Muricauda sp. SYSU M84420]
MSKVGETTLVLDLSALEHNYNYLRSKTKPKTKFLGVVKAFAYGSDMIAIAQKLEQMGVDYLAVAYVSEGVLLRKAGIKTPILVLHPLASNFEDLIVHHLEPSIYSKNILNQFLEAAKEKQQNDYPIHIKFNTGLNRLGFSEDDVDFIAKETKRNGCIKIVSAFSHLAASEDTNERDFSLKQINSFKIVSDTLSSILGYAPMRHMLNTSGIINYPEAQFEMVRSGIGLYGYGNQAKVDAQLKPVATLKTTISQIHQIDAHESVGYNRAYKSKRPIKSATLPIGHADGIGRQYGKGKGFVVINGEKATIIGNVCMDMIMVDVTKIDCQEGDEVIVFGPNNSAESFASSANTISYEILTAISQRVKRVLIGA